METMAAELVAAGFEPAMPAYPYPGLRPFEKSEWPIFFGREKMTGEIIDRLVAHRLVVVHGDSGSGKSSVVRAGVMASLEQEHGRSGNHWRTEAAMPGNGPLDELAEAIAALKGDPDARLNARRLLNLGVEAPARIVEFLAPGENEYYCLLIDQFEELFDFLRRNPEGITEAKLLVDFLIGLRENPPPRLFALVTMRSEYLGACARFIGFAETVNETQYLLPAMSTDALVRAVREPGAAYGLDIAPGLAENLVMSAGGGQDQLPLLQHGLLRMYEARPPRIAANSEGAPPPRLTRADFVGESLAEQLSSHGDAVLAAIKLERGDAASGEVERVFRAIVDKNADGQAIRRRLPLTQIAEETGLERDHVRALIAPFRADGVSFLRPYGADRIADDEQIDVTHESLIRQWKTLDGWLTWESKAGETWRALRRAANHRYELGLLSGQTLHSYHEWMANNRPSAAWTQRYGGDYNAVSTLLDDSATDERKRKRRAWLIGAAAVAGVAIASVTVPLASYFAKQRIDAATQAADGARVKAEAATVRARATLRQATRQADAALAATAAAKVTAAKAGEREAAAKAAQATAQAAQATAQAGLRIAQARSEALTSDSLALVRNSGDLLNRSVQTAIGGLFVRGVTPQAASAIIRRTSLSLDQAEKTPNTQEMQFAVHKAIAPSRAALAIASAEVDSGQGNLAFAEADAGDAITAAAQANSGDDRDDRTLIARSYAELGRARLAQALVNADGAKLDAAEQAFRSALASFDGGDLTLAPDRMYALAIARNGLAAVAARRGDAALARGIGEECVADVGRALKMKRPDDPAARQAAEKTLVLADLECFSAKLNGMPLTSPADAQTYVRSSDDQFSGLDKLIDVDSQTFAKGNVLAGRTLGFVINYVFAASERLMVEGLGVTENDLKEMYEDFIKASLTESPTSAADPRGAYAGLDALYNTELASYARVNARVFDAGSNEPAPGLDQWYALLIPYDALLARPDLRDSASAKLWTRADAENLARHIGVLAQRLAQSPTDPAELSLLILATQVTARAIAQPLADADDNARVRVLAPPAAALLARLTPDVRDALNRYPFYRMGQDSVPLKFFSAFANVAESAAQLCGSPNPGAADCVTTADLTALGDAIAASRKAEQRWTIASRNLKSSLLPVAFQGIDVVACRDDILAGRARPLDAAPAVEPFDYALLRPVGHGDIVTSDAAEAIDAAADVLDNAAPAAKPAPPPPPPLACRARRGYARFAYTDASSRQVFLFTSAENLGKFTESMRQMEEYKAAADKTKLTTPVNYASVTGDSSQLEFGTIDPATGALVLKPPPA